MIKKIDFLENIKDGYYVDTSGKIYSSLSGDMVELKQYLSKTGYFYVGLQKSNGKRKTFRAHRIVAMAFCKREDGMNIVNHINGIKKDNRSVNLEWSNDSLNMIHAYANDLWKPKREQRHSIFVDAYDFAGNNIFLRKTISEASRIIGCSKSTVKRALCEYNGVMKSRGLNILESM